MMRTSLHAILSLFNFFGVLSLNFNQDGFEVSQKTALLNFVKMPFVIALTSFLIFYEPLRVAIYNNEITLDAYSDFSQYIAIAAVSLEQATALFLCIWNYRKRIQIQKLLNRALKLLVDVKFQAEYEKRIHRIIAISILIGAFVFIIQYISVMRPTILSLCCHFLSNFPFLTLLTFMTFMKFSE
jgi:hypothetical protein